MITMFRTSLRSLVGRIGYYSKKATSVCYHMYMYEFQKIRSVEKHYCHPDLSGYLARSQPAIRAVPPQGARNVSPH